MQTLTGRLPSASEAALAKMSSRELAAFVETQAETQKVTLSNQKGGTQQIEIPTTAVKLLVDILTQLGEGNTVKLIPVHAEMTTQEGADLLGMSRPTFIKLLDDGSIPYHRVGNRRKVKYTDVAEYKAALTRKRYEALDELSALDQELGLDYQ